MNKVTQHLSDHLTHLYCFHRIVLILAAGAGFFNISVFPSCAELITLKSGEVIRAKIIKISPVYIRTEPRTGDNRKEFLVEEIAKIEQDKTQENQISELAIKNIELRQSDAISRDLRKAAVQKATEIVEQAMNELNLHSLRQAPGEVRTAAMEIANTLVAEAVTLTGEEKFQDLKPEAKEKAEEYAKHLLTSAVQSMKTEGFMGDLDHPSDQSKISSSEAVNLQQPVQVRSASTDGQETEGGWISPGQEQREPQPRVKYIEKVIQSDQNQEIIMRIPVELDANPPESDDENP